MMLSALLAELRRRNIKLIMEGGKLRCQAPVGAMTDELEFQLRSHKKEILEFFEQTFIKCGRNLL